ncbi:hypothetical protein EYF80_036779 [Xyrichtys novacula]|uniref:Uncharacterized protein n=1 Tax=Xyrichtys novacula TaxID=13765 RepID=A0AAV1G7E9_XYRNO|nr:hypothetical protein EYF80_036779 [Xyrichtys novacula]
MIESGQETALASQTVIIRTYSELTKMERERERERGSEKECRRCERLDDPIPTLGGASGNAMPRPNMTDSAVRAWRGWEEEGRGGDRGHEKTSSAPDSSASPKKEATFPSPSRRGAPKLGVVTVLNA